MTDDGPRASLSAHDGEEHMHSQIRITDALSSTEFSKSSYIVYVISSPGHEAKRRYSDFEALREALARLNAPAAETAGTGTAGTGTAGTGTAGTGGTAAPPPGQATN